MSLKAVFHQAEFSARSDMFFCLKTNWWRVGVKRQKKISFRAENPAKWKTTLKGKKCSLTDAFVQFSLKPGLHICRKGRKYMFK